MTAAPKPRPPTRNVKVAVAIVIGLALIGASGFVLVQRNATSFGGGSGFLGTRAGLFADLNLIAQIVLLLGLATGFAFARIGKSKADRQAQSDWISAHQYNQTGWVLFNIVLTIFIMAAVFARQVAPDIPDNLREAYGAVSTLHAALGLITILCGVYILLRMNRLLPKSLRVSWWKNLMRVTLALYWVVGLFGVGTYYVWYVQPRPAAPIPTPAPTQPGEQPSGVVDVFLSNYTFNAPEITIPVGTTVVFHNLDPETHTITFDRDDFPARELKSGEAHEITFDAVGDFPYHCEFHGAPGEDMHGVIHVTEAAELPTAAPSPTRVPTDTPRPTSTPTAPPTATETGAPTATPTDTPTPGPSPTPTPVTVIFKNFEIVPRELTIPAGTKVIFLIQDSQHEPYQSAPDSTAITGFDSGPLDPGQTYSLTFNTPGTYTIRCGFHPNQMVMTLIVTP
jgi:plastocyanin/uncharacterized membrane protein YozB (DUF420 family)